MLFRCIKSNLTHHEYHSQRQCRNDLLCHSLRLVPALGLAQISSYRYRSPSSRSTYKFEEALCKPSQYEWAGYGQTLNLNWSRWLPPSYGRWTPSLLQTIAGCLSLSLPLPLWYSASSGGISTRQLDERNSKLLTRRLQEGLVEGRRLNVPQGKPWSLYDFPFFSEKER